MDSRLGKPIYEGAEAQLYLIKILGEEFLVKYRLSKPYRHPVFDKLFRVTRTKIEARVMADLYLMGLNIPPPIFADPGNAVLVIKKIDGVKLVEIIDSISRDELADIARKIGQMTAVMHRNRIYHGDLTLGNIIVTSLGEPYIIDFGLSGYSSDIEEYAIDVHLLERSLNAMAPRTAEVFMKYFWEGYGKVDEQLYRDVSERAKEIRLRGRYVSERLRRRFEKYVG